MRTPALIKRFLKSIAFVSFILLSSNRASAQQVYINPDSLQWANFKGSVDTTSPFVAFTKSWFGDSYKFSAAGVITSAKIKVVLIQDSSWVNYEKLNRLPATTQTYLLNHERIHYLLTIIEAKKLKREILDKTILTPQELNSAMGSHAGILKNRNVQYDAETNHSKIVDAQNRWANLVKDELEGLKDILIDQ